MNTTFTPGPWRWEINMKSRSLHLVSGLRPKYDLTIIDFDRWGMNGATMSLRDTAHDGMNIMHKLHERPDWIAPFAGRAHHAHWCANVIHPDARLMAAAPKLLHCLRVICDHAEGREDLDVALHLDVARAVIAEATD